MKQRWDSTRRSLSTDAPRGFIREASLIAAAMLAYFDIRNSTVGGEDEALANAEHIVDLEQWLHVAWEDEIQGTIIGTDVLVTLTNWVYIWDNWPVILGAAIALYLGRRERYHLLRNALFVSDAIGFAFFAFLPVAPPRLLDLGLVDTATTE